MLRERVLVPARLCFALRTRQGTRREPAVAANQRVERNDVIARGADGLPLHAPLRARVVSVGASDDLLVLEVA